MGAHLVEKIDKLSHAQILDKAIYISLRAKAAGKGMIHVFFSSNG